MIITLLELAAVVFVIWGFCNEEKFVDFEKKIFKALIDKTVNK
jgi:hypothetical protein